MPRAMSSLTLLAGTEGWTTSRPGPDAIKVLILAATAAGPAFLTTDPPEFVVVDAASPDAAEAD